MRKASKNVPKLRFPEFNEDWEQRKLGEISNKVTEKNKEYLFTETLTNSAEYGIISQRDFFDKDISNKKNLNGYYIVRENDFVYNPRISNSAPVGPIKRNKLGRTGVMSPLYYVFRTHDINRKFLEYYFHTTIWNRFMELNGDSGARADRFAIKDSVFEELPIPYPDSDEQKKIGNFFNLLDNNITSHHHKLNRLCDMKSSLLQKMFPKDEKHFPEIRFPEFAGLWKQEELGNMGKPFMGLTGKTKEDFGHGQARFITYMNVYSNPIADPTRTESIEIDSGQNEVKYGDILFTVSSEIPEEVGMSSVWLESMPNIYLNSFCFGYRPETLMNPYYLGSMLRSPVVRKKIIFLAQGISRYNISKAKVMNVAVPIPISNEQKKIGCFFKQLDKLIDMHKQKLEHTKELKKALLQSMFV